MHYRIVENSPFARIARLFFGSKRIAMVLGSTIHLSGVDRQRFISDRKWLIHELMHVEQYRQNGFVKFLFLYILESIRHGYYQNRFEVEAREAEERGVIQQDRLTVLNVG
ncbi:MAG TPA: hypothetical protein VNB90_03460 [Cytophagaceae bacterium]|nr:hypothetical protein [Cytophagaceae bacterium]